MASGGSGGGGGRGLDFGLLIIRIGFGAYLIKHGWGKIAAGPELWQKLGGAVEQLGVPMPKLDVNGYNFTKTALGFMAMLSETLGAAFVIIGWMFRPAATLVFITMAVATALHISKNEGFEVPLLYALAFLGLAFAGPGSLQLAKPEKPKI